MMHRPIELDQISLIFPHKICFENFTTTIRYGDRIAIIGRNGSGKSSLLSLLSKKNQKDTVFGYVPQLIEDVGLSGAERFQDSLTRALSISPNCLLLDEPTNHLDQHHRKNLFRLLNAFSGTLIVVSHDVELLQTSINTLWHIDNSQIHVFSGNYDDYIKETRQHRASIEHELSRLNKEKKKNHLSSLS